MRTSVASLASLLCLGLASPALALTIDNFEAGSFTVVDVAPGPTLGQQAGLAPDVVGGVRLVRANATNGGTVTSSLTTTAGPDAATVSFADAAAPFGQGDVQFLYDGFADGVFNALSGQLNLDLSSFLTIDVEAAALPGVGTLQVTLWDSASSQSSIAPIVNGTNSFLLAGFGAIDLTTIKSIRVALAGIDAGESVDLLEISANDLPVPEPGTALLLGLGLVGLGLRRSRES